MVIVDVENDVMSKMFKLTVTRISSILIDENQNYHCTNCKLVFLDIIQDFLEMYT